MSRYVNLNKMNLSAGSDSSSFFSKFQSAGAGMNLNTILIIVAVILLIALGVYCYNYYMSNYKQASYKPNNEIAPSTSNNQAELMLFYVDWCPHCKTAKPVWEEVKAEYQNKTVNGYQVMFTEINCTNETPDVEQMMNKYSIEGFPTIKLLKDGQVIEYDAKPTKATLEQFLNTVL